MGKWSKLIVAAAAPLVLTACLWSPGKFVSELTMRKNGTYTLDYKGEIVLQLPESEKEMTPRPWSDAMARCFKGGRSETVDLVSSDDSEEVRDCTTVELARLKADHDRKEAQRVASKRQESEQMAKVFGLPGNDQQSNRKFAATMMKYKGWRSVSYQGKGKYLVDYHADGSLAQDVVFPLIPDSDLILPFIALRRRADGSVLVTAPAFTGGSGPFGARAKMMDLPDKGDGPQSLAQGRFIIVTDGEILTNNSEDGAVPHAGGRQLKWDVDAASTKLPEALVKL
ncbi:MAG: hypothetical protein LH485_08190 [Sphingomonas bacterium]|nr:hypothetical protein [Sphingomonas bacterium]